MSKIGTSPLGIRGSAAILQSVIMKNSRTASTKSNCKIEKLGSVRLESKNSSSAYLSFGYISQSVDDDAVLIVRGQGWK